MVNLIFVVYVIDCIWMNLFFRLSGDYMLKFLKGKRLVFVGDFLNRNMWELLVCIFRNSVKKKENVYEVYGRYYFRIEVFYLFVFKVRFGILIYFF